MDRRNSGRPHPSNPSGRAQVLGLESNVSVLKVV